MVLTPKRAWLGLLTLCVAVGVSACTKKKVVLRTADRVDLTAAWVVDREGLGAPDEAPKEIEKATAALLDARNLRQTSVDPAEWSEAFERRRATPHRLAWLGERADVGGLLMLVELRPYFDNLSQGRFRWIVAAHVTVMPAGAPERALDKSFEIPVFLQFRYEGEDAAMRGAQGELTRRIAKLVDTVLQDPDATWELDDPAPQARRTLRLQDLEGMEDPKAYAAKAQQARPAPQAAPPPRPQAGPVYFVMLDRFANGDASNDGDVDLSDPQGFHGGDLRGLIDHLDHIQDLGFATVWVSPLTTMQRTPFGRTGGFHGYWMADPYTLDPHLGSAQDLVDLTDELARRGMGLVLDVVTNHVAYTSPWVSERPGWFHPARTIRDWNDPQQVTDGQVHGLPDLNQDVPEVYDWLQGAASSWIDRARPVGFRLDAVRHVPDRFWKRFNADVRGLAGEGFLQVGELFDGSPVKVAQTWRDGDFRQMLDFPLHYALVDVVCRGALPATLPALLDLDRVYPDAADLLTFVDNHDLPRIASQCPDQAAVLDALALMYGLRGIPTVMYGTEAGLDGASEPDNRADMVFGDTPMGDHLARLTALRAQLSPLRSTATRALHVSHDGFALLAATPSGAVVVAYSRTEPMVVPLTVAPLPPITGAVDALGGRAVSLVQGAHGGAVSLSVAPGGVAFVQLSAGPGASWSEAVRWAQSTDTEVLRFEARAPGVSGLKVVGGAPELGAWSADAGLSLVRQGEAWVGEVTVPAGQVLAYKLVAVGDGGSVTWEDGPNRFVFEPKGPAVQRPTWGTRG